MLPCIVVTFYSYNRVRLRAKQLQVEMGQYATFVSVSVLTMTALDKSAANWSRSGTTENCILSMSTSFNQPHFYQKRSLLKLIQTRRSHIGPCRLAVVLHANLLLLTSICLTAKFNEGKKWNFLGLTSLTKRLLVFLITLVWQTSSRPTYLSATTCLLMLVTAWLVVLLT